MECANQMGSKMAKTKIILAMYKANVKNFEFDTSLVF